MPQIPPFKRYSLHEERARNEGGNGCTNSAVRVCVCVCVCVCVRQGPAQALVEIAVMRQWISLCATSRVILSGTSHVII